MFRTTCLVALTIALGISGACVRSEQPPQRELSQVAVVYPIQLVGPTVDWRPQDYTDSQGVNAVAFDADSRCLVVYCDLKGKDGHKSRGEILLDLNFVPTLVSPVDMRDRRITVELALPRGFIASEWAANGVQILLKDHQWRSVYGEWHNCTQRGSVSLTLSTSAAYSWSVRDPGVDLSKIRFMGIKFAINDRSTAAFAGTIRIKRFTVDPPLPFTSPPDLPEQGPYPWLTNDAKVRLEKDGFHVDGRKTFLVGGNWRVLEYGQTFGTVEEWFANGIGVSTYPGFVAAKMRDFRRAGITVLRVGLLDDGRAVLDKTGRVVGYDDMFRRDVQTFLDLAARFNLRVEFVLLDYLVAGRGEDVDGVWLRGRQAVIEDPAVRSAFVNDFLVRFLQEFGSHRALLSLDLMNEPEWVVAAQDGGGWETVEDKTTKATTPVSGEAFRKYVATCTEAIRRLAPDKLVTVGVSCKYIGLTENLDLDYLAPHYYPWMGSLVENLSAIPKDKPYILEEFPGRGSLTTYLEQVRSSGGAGALLWNLSPGIDPESYRFQDEEAKLQEIRSFVDSGGQLPETKVKAPSAQTP